MPDPNLPSADVDSEEHSEADESAQQGDPDRHGSSVAEDTGRPEARQTSTAATADIESASLERQSTGLEQQLEGVTVEGNNTEQAEEGDCRTGDAGAGDAGASAGGGNADREMNEEGGGGGEGAGEESLRPLTPADVDALLDRCLLQALCTSVKPGDLPLGASILW